MPDTYAGFIDVGFLRAEGARALGHRNSVVRPIAAGVVSWLKTLEPEGAETFLRAYWYDGAFPPDHPDAPGQRSFFDAIANTPGVQLRLGHIAERRDGRRAAILGAIRRTADALGVEQEAAVAEFERHFQFRPIRQQKGVDTLIALDLVRLAGRSVCSTAVLISGDRDLAEAVRAAQDFGTRVIVAAREGVNAARELGQLADEVIPLTADDLGQMLATR